MVDFVGSDEDSQNDKCPAVFRDPLTGDFYQQGRLVKDPALLERFGQDISLAEDEVVVWQPASLGPSLLEAATGDYEPGRTGPGVPSFAELLAATKRSAVHLEMRETYGPDDPEGLLRQEVGGRDVMRAQIEHLITLACGDPTVAIQVMPLSVGAHAGMDGPFTLMSFSTGRDIVSIESMRAVLHLNGPEDVEAYRTVSDLLKSDALPPQASITMLTAIAKDLE